MVVEGKLDLSTLDDGIYVLKIDNESTNETRKVI